MPALLTLALAASPLAAQDVLGEPLALWREPGSIRSIATGNFGGPLPGLLIRGEFATTVLPSPILEGADRVLTVPYGTPPPHAAAASDLNGDGIDEVVTQSLLPGGPTWEWFEVDASGTSLELAGSSGPTLPVVTVKPTDLDGDGDADFVCRTEYGRLVWFENDAGKVDPVHHSLPGVPSPGRSVFDWEYVDLNGDGFDDIVAYVWPDPEIFVIPSSGGGSFGTPFALMQTAVPSGWAFIDDDSDGDLDVFSVIDTSVVRAENLGGFAFTPAATILPGGGAVDSRSVLGATDLDGDGDVDLLLSVRVTWSSHNVDAYSLHLGGGTWGAVTTQGAPEYGARFSTDLITDLDGDGLDDYVRRWWWQGLLIRRARAGNPVSTLDPQIEFTFPHVTSSAVFADADGDGDEDVYDVAVSQDGRGRIRLFVNKGSAARFEELPPSTVSTYLPFIRSGDLDGDGDDDLVAADQMSVPVVLLSSGHGVTDATVQPHEANGVERHSLELCDVDGDGDLDIAYALRVPGAPHRLIVQLNEGGAMGWTRRDLFEITPDSSSERFVFDDFDGDGVTDLLAARSLPGVPTTWFLRGLGGGQFDPPQPAQPNRRMSWLVDVDGDGFEDMITDLIPPDVALRIPGTATFSTVTTPLTAWVPEPIRPTAVADLDGDGREDLIGEALDPSLPLSERPRVYLAQPGGGFGPRVDSAPWNWAWDGDPADVDGDGDLDVLTRATRGSTIVSSGYLQLEILPGLTRTQIGESVCGPATLNSTGRAAGMLAFGQAAANTTDLEIRAFGLPSHTHGIFLVSTTVTPPTPVAGSAGSLCLGGAVGRYDSPGQIINSGLGGELRLPIDSTQIPQGTGTVAAQAGQTWSFQAWFRDVENGAATSNFSDALSISF